MSKLLFSGPGEMPRRCAEFSWAETPLGAPEQWSPTLRATTAAVLASGFPTILLWGPQLTQIYNDAYIRFLGVKHPSALGRPTHDVWPETRHITEPIYERVFAGETVTNERQRYLLAKSGPDAPLEEFFITVSFAPVGEPGMITGVLVTAMDVTAEVEAHRLELEREMLMRELEAERARLGEIFQMAPSFIAVLQGPDQTYAMVNDAYAQIIGHRDVVGRPLLEALPEIREQGFKELLDRVRDTGEPWVGRATPVQLQRTRGAPAETRYLDMIFQTLRDADGRGIGVVAHGSDVTEHVLAVRALESAAHAEERRAAAEAASRAKSEFLAVVSHELRTPLNAIGGYVDLLDLGIRGPLTEAQRADLTRIRQSQRHLSGLINQILNLTRIETGTLAFAATDIPVCDAVTAAETLVRPQLEASGLGFECTAQSSGLRVRADPEKLQQILLNLLTNAIKFTGEGGTICVDCEPEGDRVLLRVRDTGIGIPPEHQRAIFEPFVQIDASLTRTRDGLGLGLSISRQLAIGMGGDLWVDSVPGRGSTFTLALQRSETG